MKGGDTDSSSCCVDAFGFSGLEEKFEVDGNDEEILPLLFDFGIFDKN